MTASDRQVRSLFNSPANDSGEPPRIELAQLKPFAQEPERALSFGDLQAAFGTGLVVTRHSAAILCDAQLIRRIPPHPGGKPTYLCQKTLVDLLAGRRPRPLSRAQALSYAYQTIEAMAAWNGQGSAVRVVGIAFKGRLLDPSVAAVDGVEVVVTARVKRGSTLAQELAGLLGALRDVGSGALREALMLEVQTQVALRPTRIRQA